MNRVGAFFFCAGRLRPSLSPPFFPPSRESFSPLHTPVPCILSVAPTAYMTPSAAVFRVQKIGIARVTMTSWMRALSEGLLSYPRRRGAETETGTGRDRRTATRERTTKQMYINSKKTHNSHDGDEFDVKVQRGVRRNHAAGAALTVPELGGNDELPLPPDAHGR